ncbi:MAG: hypothetical protein LBM23_00005 [Propionibacteriaceae bacterium]|nr:hypothetical protein [Propionibacteriaceae bacterium]
MTATEALRSIFVEHSFSTVRDENWLGFLDVQLFKAMKDNCFDAIVTRSIKQLVIPDERKTLRDLGLSWIGLPTPKFKGIQGLALETATIVAGLPYVLIELQQQLCPTAYQ